MIVTAENVKLRIEVPSADSHDGKWVEGPFFLSLSTSSTVFCFFKGDTKILKKNGIMQSFQSLKKTGRERVNININKLK